jgi:hypothetical protein
MTLRQHIAKAVKYWLWVGLVSFVILPLWFAAWWFIGFPPGGDASLLDPTTVRIDQILGISLHAVLAPARLLLARTPLFPSTTFGTATYWFATLVLVAIFWGTLIYIFIQFYRYARLRHQKV